MWDENYLRVYSDGSATLKSRRGGAGVHMIFPNGETVNFSSLSYPGATNNEMELQSCILALSEIKKLEDSKKFQGIIIYSDSEYIVSNYKKAIFAWSKQKWIRNNGEPVLNAQQWEKLIRLMQGIYEKFYARTYFEKIKAHSGIEGNEIADNLAKKSREGPINTASLSKGRVRKSKFSNQTTRGSIRAEGQNICLFVVTEEWLDIQKLYQLRCEVISEESKYFGNKDFLYSAERMKAGHSYEVVLDDKKQFIKTIIKEINGLHKNKKQ